VAAKKIAAAITDFKTHHTQQLIDVSGEEDLLAIPAILLAPLSSVVVYGQFDQGIVVAHVTEQNKKRVYDLFGKFQ
jgi:GTP-dependent dephospho-CoA kinase